MGIITKAVVTKPNKSKITFGRFYSIDGRLDGEVGAFNRAEDCRNFSTLDGALKISEGGIGFDGKYVLPTSRAISLYFYKRNDVLTGEHADRLMLYCEDSKIYECPIEGGVFTPIDELTFSEAPIGLCYNYNGVDCMILVGKSKYLKIYDGETTKTVVDVPEITSTCIHAERLFATSDGVDGALWFSDDFNPENWNVSLSEAGFIDMSDERGEMIGVVSFANYVYVFRTYGISRVTAFANQEEFSVSHLLTSCGRILKDTVVCCGDCVTFIASDGVYSFDGYSANKISEPLDGKIDFSMQTLSGAYYNGYVYYLLKGDGQTDILKILPNGGDYSLISLGNVTCLTTVNAENGYKLLGLDGDANQLFEMVKSGKHLGDFTEKRWKSKKTDFGITAKNKVLTELSFNLKGSCEVVVTSDLTGRTFVAERSGRVVLRPNIKGNIFDFEIISKEEEVEVSGLTVTLSYYL